VQSNDIIDVLESDEAATFIDTHFKGDFKALSLRFAGKTGFNITVCLQIMELYKKAEGKIPFFVNHKLALEKRSYEQSTSQKVASYKHEFIKGDRLLDITAGLGVDSMFLSNGFKDVIAVERNVELHNLAIYNLAKAKIDNVRRIKGDGKNELNRHFDWVYIDPDRRVDQKRVVTLENLEPNVLDLLIKLEKYAARVYIKISPLFDVQEVWRKFKNCETVHLIAEKGEVKEVGVVLNHSEIKNEQRLILKDVVSGFTKEILRDNLSKTLPVSDKKFENILIPDPLVAKANCSAYLLKTIEARKHKSFELYFSSEMFNEGFRTFKIIEESNLSAKIIKSNLQRLGISQINIIIKGLNDKPSIWHNKLRTRDGGDYYLIILKAGKSEAFLVKKVTS
jgi:16S rRNA G966 N2-methylase RsmD